MRSTRIIDESGAPRLLIIGGSAGALSALRLFLPKLTLDENTAAVICFHQYPYGTTSLATGIRQLTGYPVHEAADQLLLKARSVYVCPANYHTLVDGRQTVLSCEPPVNFSRPSIDVFFASAAEQYGDAIVAVVLSGANNDGTHGARRVKAFGGQVIAQQPDTAEVGVMPASVAEAGVADFVAAPGDMVEVINGCMVVNQGVV